MLGELWNHDFFKILLPFLLGFLSNYGITKIVEKQKLAKIKKFYLSWLGFSLEKVGKQAVRLEEYEGKMKSNRNFSGNLAFNKNQLDKLGKLHYEELYDVFVLKNKGNSRTNAKVLFELMDGVDYLVLFDKTIFKKYEEYMVNIKGLNVELSEAMVEFNSIVDRYIISYKDIENLKVDSIFNLKESWNQKSNELRYDPESYLLQYVTPIRKIFAADSLKHKDVTIVNGLNATQRIFDIIDRKSKVYQTFLSNLSHYIKEIRNTERHIKENVKYFERSPWPWDSW